jgi:eukaryotic-like serine/threonine-protein kinase
VVAEDVVVEANQPVSDQELSGRRAGALCTIWMTGGVALATVRGNGMLPGSYTRTATLVEGDLPFLVQLVTTPMRDDASDQPGVTGRCYRIERLIGTGGAAAVYEARRLGPNGPSDRVACKVMHAERRDAPGYRALVWDEAVLGLRVTAGHPNLVEVLDFFDDAQEQLCIVMELVDGASVAALRGPVLRLPFPIARRIAVEVLEALVHLHGRNVLHRDLSLGNILVTAGGAVKVTDFGIARVMEQGQVHTSEIRGTAVYLSAEALNQGPLDARSDLFSLGAVVYDLVVGHPPCGNQNMLGAIYARNLFGNFEPLPPDTPADLAELITGLIKTDREARRPQTAAEALALLRGCGQPMASHEELAAMVSSAQSRRDQELADHRPANGLPPGHVLAPRDQRARAERAAGAPPGPVAGRADEALPARVAQSEAESAASVLPARVADPANPLPDLVAERALDAVLEHIDDVLPDAVADRAPAPVADLAADAQPDRVAARRFGVRRALLTATIGACVLVFGFLLDDGFRGEQAAVELQQRSEAPALVAEPVPAAPILNIPAPAPAHQSPRHALESANGPRHDRIETQSRSQQTRPLARRWEYVPPASEWPPWVQR